MPLSCYDSRKKRSSTGQALLIITLWLAILGLGGLCWYLFSVNTEQNTAIAALRDDLKGQESNIKNSNETIETLRQKIYAQIDAVDTQERKASLLEKDTSLIKESISKITEETATIKNDVQRRQEESRTALTGIEKKLDQFAEQINLIATDIRTKMAVPVIETTIESIEPPVVPARKKAKK